MFWHNSMETMRHLSQVQWAHVCFSLLTAAFIVRWPKSCCYFLAGYLIIGGLVGFALTTQMAISTLAIGVGLLIMIFPRQIAYLFAPYLLILGILLVLEAGGWRIALLPFGIGILLITFPRLASYYVACYLTINSLSILLFQD
jgi:hypothetical protein